MSTTKHYVDENNIYLGGFGDDAEPPTGSVEVPAPQDGRETWDGVKWLGRVVSLEEIENDIDHLLSETDWTQMPDADLTTPEKAQWDGYRASLRAMDRTPRPRDLGFPVPPSDTKRNGR